MLLPALHFDILVLYYYTGTFYRPSVPATTDSNLSFHSFRSFDLLAGLMLLFL